jgi:predicted amidohydrolase YtcJ
MQQTHCTSDMPWAPERLGPKRIAGAYAWRRFLDLGLPLAGGSDFPVESHDPRLGLYAAVTTRGLDGGPEAGYRPDQKLTRREALWSFTRWAAYAAFEETTRGQVQPGFQADLTVFDRDLETCPPEELLQAQVVMTMVAGEVVHRQP